MARVPKRRWITEYDLAGGQVRADGTRIAPQLLAGSSNASIDRLLKEGHSIVQNPRGGWMAADAAGSWTLPKSKKRRPNDKRSQAMKALDELIPFEDFEPEIAAAENKEDTPVPQKKKRKESWVAKQRRLDEENMTWLEAPKVYPPGTRAPPSSYMLHGIHRFAAHHYEERGMMLDLPTILRAEDNERRKAKRNKGKGKGKIEDVNGEEVDQLDERSDSWEDVESKPTGAGRLSGDTTGRNPSSKLPAKKVIDMYGALDGDVLMCIGMLLKEHIASQLSSHKPENWVEPEADLDPDKVEGPKDFDPVALLAHAGPSRAASSLRHESSDGDEEDEDDESDREDEDEDELEATSGSEYDPSEG